MSTYMHELDEGGYIRLVGATVDIEDLGSGQPFNLDEQIVRAARVSYQGGTSSFRPSAGLIDYLIRNYHTSPVEMPHLKFEIRAPLFVVQQILRHRTANINQESARYSVIEDSVFIPGVFRSQDGKNKQMSGADLDQAVNDAALEVYLHAYDTAYSAYEQLLELGVAREQARMILPVGIFTKLVWQMDLHNLFSFIRLRDDPHAQPEIQVYARAMGVIISELAPNAWASFEKHILSKD